MRRLLADLDDIAASSPRRWLHRIHRPALQEWSADHAWSFVVQLYATPSV